MLSVIKFSSERCMPCKALEPVFNQIQAEYGGLAKFSLVDVDKSREVAQYYFVSSVPTVIFLVDDTEVSRIVGVKPKSEYEKVIQKFQNK